MKESSKYIFLISVFFLLLHYSLHGQDNLIPFKNKKENLYGFKSTSGKVVVKPQYEWVGYTFVNGHTLVQKNGKNGVMNVKGEIIINLLYSSIDIHAYAKDSVISVSINDKYGYIDKTGNVLIPIEYENAGNYRNGQYRLQKDGKWGIVNIKGEVLLPFKYSNIVAPFCNGYATVDIQYGNDTIDNKNFQKVKFGYVDTLNNEFLYDVNSQLYKANTYSVKDELFNNADLFKLDESSKFKKELADSLFSYSIAKFNTEQQRKSYCDLNKFNVGYGLLLNGEILRDTKFFTTKKEAEYFTKHTFHKIISTEYLREMTWAWIAPIYKEVFQSTNSIIQKSYKEIAIYLKNYINNYDKKQVELYLEEDERNFARKDINGNFDPYRKLSAFIDRLIIIHKVIDVKDAKHWVNKISDEVLNW